jgi:very-short-patch-repair endonuclease
VPGVKTHSGRLTRADRDVRNGIPVTSAARTIIDAAYGRSASDVDRLVRQAQFRKLFLPDELREVLQRRPCRSVRVLLDDLAPTQSGLEDRFLRLCDRFGLPRPETQDVRGRTRPDFVWRAERLVVEVDSWSAHGTPRAFQADRAQSNALQLSGWTILRFTYADVTRRPASVAAQMRSALGARGR